jgi:hypothetical protein
LPACLRIDVTDEGTAGFEPVVTLPHPGQNSGRGFWIVDQLTDRWGVDFSRSTRVWCEFDLHDRRQQRLCHRPATKNPRSETRSSSTSVSGAPKAAETRQSAT